MKGLVSRRVLTPILLVRRTLSDVHNAAKKGFTAESAALYEKGRPEYSAACLDHLISLIIEGKADPTSTSIVELGAGTGKFTACFAQHAQRKNTLGALTFLATEPSEGFRQTLQGKTLQGVSVSPGLGDRIPAASGSVDAVLVAQAFHWIASLPTLQEVHRVLRPSGLLLLLWNTFDYRTPWLCQIDQEVLSPAYGPLTPRQQTGRWRDCFLSPQGGRLFPLLKDWYHDTTQEGDRAMVLNRVMSTSVIAEQGQEAREQVSRTVHRILDQAPDLEESRRTGRYSIPYVTHVAWARPAHNPQ